MAISPFILISSGGCGCLQVCGPVFSCRQVLIFHPKLTIMSSKFAIIGVVSVLGAGAVMHHARFCPLQKMMAAIHHHHATTVVVKAPAPAAKVAATSVAMK